MTQAEADHAIADARAAGISMEVLEWNLSLTVEQRILQHETAREVVDNFEKQRGKKFSELASLSVVRVKPSFVIEARERDEWLLIHQNAATDLQSFR